jgi:hypothetical protein
VRFRSTQSVCLKGLDHRRQPIKGHSLTGAGRCRQELQPKEDAGSPACSQSRGFLLPPVSATPGSSRAEQVEAGADELASRCTGVEHKRQIMPLGGCAMQRTDDAAAHEDTSDHAQAHEDSEHLAHTPLSTPPALRNAGMAEKPSEGLHARRSRRIRVIARQACDAAGPCLADIWAGDKEMLVKLLAENGEAAETSGAAAAPNGDLTASGTEGDVALKSEREALQFRARPAKPAQQELMISTPPRAFLPAPARAATRQAFLKKGWALCANCSKPCDVAWGACAAPYC